MPSESNLSSTSLIVLILLRIASMIPFGTAGIVFSAGHGSQQHLSSLRIGARHVDKALGAEGRRTSETESRAAGFDHGRNAAAAKKFGPTLGQRLTPDLCHRNQIGIGFIRQASEPISDHVTDLRTPSTTQATNAVIDFAPTGTRCTSAQ